jgi:DNA primase
MARIPEHIIEQIKESNDIVDVVSSYMSLTRKGQNYWARCPFHQEKTASFSVNPSKQIYHCFGCGVGGNVVNFVMAYEKLTFPETLNMLAERAGINLEEYSYKPSDEEKSIRSHLFDLHKLAINIYEKELASPSGKTAREYLIKRGFEEKTLREFHVGFAPDSWDTLLKAARAKKIEKNILDESGLIVTSEKNKQFDRFRNRIMFPIYDLHGNPVGFGGRIISGEDKEMKYLNSPETPVYHKSRILYGLSKSRDEIRKTDTVLIVEGYMDLLQLWQNGFRNIIAGSGTAFTTEHARIIRRFAGKAVLCYDGDEAGQKAAVKTGLVLAPRGIACKVLKLPAKEDPDSYVRQVGSKAFSETLDNAVEFIPFLESLINPLRLTPARRSEAVRRLLEQLGEFSDPVIEEMFLADLSRIFGTDMIVLKNQMLRNPGRKEKETILTDTDRKEQRFTNRAEAAQYQLIQLLINTTDESIRKAALEYLKEDLFTHDFLKKTLKYILLTLKEDQKISGSTLAEKCNDNKIQRFIYRLVMEGYTFNNPQKTFLDCLIRLGEQKIRDQLTLIGEKLRDSDKKGEFPEKLLKEKQDLINRLKNLGEKINPEIFNAE